MNSTTLELFATLFILPTALFVNGCDTGTPAETQSTVTLRAIEEGIFEFDGDATNDDMVLGTDWDVVNTTGGASLAHTGVLADAAPNSIFNGGRKDTQDISSWSHKNGSVPDKDDITNAYAAAYDANGDLVIYFGADRFANSGDAQLGFWFFQESVTALPNGSFSGAHEIGDLLVLVNFETGGTNPSINVLEWVGSGGDQQGGTLQLLTSAGSLCGSDSDQDVCAITNSMAEDSPWDYTPKGGTFGADFPPQTFFEGGINISALFGTEDAPCFASFMAETRSSTSVAASLKDFTLGQFPLCAINVAQTCTSGALNNTEDGFDYAYSGTVTNSGFGTLYDVEVTAEGSTFSLGSLAPGADATFSGTFSSTQNPAGSSASVSAATESDGPAMITDSSGSSTCPSTSLSPSISVTKQCETELEVVSDLVVVKAKYAGQVCNDTDGVGAVSLSNVTVTDDAGTPGDDSDDTVFDIGDLDPGECQSYSGSYRPSSTNSSDPALADFEDTVTAFGEAPLGFGTATETATASCSLCPQPPAEP